MKTSFALAMAAAAVTAQGNSTLSIDDVEHILEGIIYGATEKTAFPKDLGGCGIDLATTINEVQICVSDFKNGRYQDGIKYVGWIAKTLAVDVTDCEKVTTDLSELAKMAKIFENPKKLAIKVGEDLIVNGTQIYGEIEDSIKQYDAAQYYKFGEDLGKAMELVFVGDKDQEYESLEMSS